MEFLKISILFLTNQDQKLNLYKINPNLLNLIITK